MFHKYSQCICCIYVKSVYISLWFCIIFSNISMIKSDSETTLTNTDALLKSFYVNKNLEALLSSGLIITPTDYLTTPTMLQLHNDEHHNHNDGKNHYKNEKSPNKKNDSIPITSTATIKSKTHENIVALTTPNIPEEKNTKSKIKTAKTLKHEGTKTIEKSSNTTHVSDINIDKITPDSGANKDGDNGSEKNNGNKTDNGDTIKVIVDERPTDTMTASDSNSSNSTAWNFTSKLEDATKNHENDESSKKSKINLVIIISLMISCLSLLLILYLFCILVKHKSKTQTPNSNLDNRSANSESCSACT